MLQANPPRAKYSDIDYRGLPPLFPERADFWTIPRIAEGETVYILGGGESFKAVDPELLRDKIVIGCNEAYRLGSELVDYCHFTDLKWWQQHQKELQNYDGEVTTCQKLVTDKSIHLLKIKQAGIEFADPCKIAINRNTGLGAINIAVHMGATRIVLLGFDMGKGGTGHHWYDRDESGSRENTYRMHRKYALEVWEDANVHGGIEIINASPESTLPFWPKCLPSEAFDLPPSIPADNVVTRSSKNLRVVCVMKSGGVYNADDVRNLRRQLKDSLTVNYEFVCYSDIPEVADVLLEHDLPGSWSKLEVFRETGPCIFIDLDTYIPGNIDALAEQVGRDQMFAMLVQGAKDEPLYYGSSMMAWSGDYSFILNEFRPELIPEMRLDDKYTSLRLRAHGIAPQLIVDMIQGVYNWRDDLASTGGVPDDASVVYFLPGGSKPRDLGAPYFIKEDV